MATARAMLERRRSSRVRIHIPVKVLRREPGGETRDAHATATVEIADSKQFYIRRHRLENAWLRVYDLIGNTIRRWRGQPPVVRSNLNM